MIDIMKKWSCYTSVLFFSLLVSSASLCGDTASKKVEITPQPPKNSLTSPAPESSGRKPADTPYGKDYPKENPELEFISFDIYDKEPIDPNIKPTDKLAKLSTGFVFGMLTVKNLLYNVKDKDYKVTYKYLNAKGEALGQFDATFSTKKDWDYATFYSSWGWASPGYWAVGDYTLEMWIEGIKFAVRSFSITNE